ncbi:aspartyl-phosphate phosphatase Spo0E family protein [Halobacillus litoralis]|uniref:aspartyl-phosphate phosphatase Spo0E family protein n=1 Tax=Halobacillus litoralis TaxID=45668 RepID=UPI001CD1DCF6|nr:aspartyl-phosphate phosphatase Spo0E family protein [Halobacillus litoralis]MCA0969472.1 aspartyl-phosphate phosphatase Spo0E family protein [Halobacillus litoralis]
MDLNEQGSLLDEVEKLRQKMIDVARHQGFASEESVEISQRLDQLLNQLQTQQTN